MYYLGSPRDREHCTDGPRRQSPWTENTLQKTNFTTAQKKTHLELPSRSSPLTSSEEKMSGKVSSCSTCKEHLQTCCNFLWKTCITLCPSPLRCSLNWSSPPAPTWILKTWTGCSSFLHFFTFFLLFGSSSTFLLIFELTCSELSSTFSLFLFFLPTSTRMGASSILPPLKRALLLRFSFTSFSTFLFVAVSRLPSPFFRRTLAKTFSFFKLLPSPDFFSSRRLGIVDALSLC